MIRSAIPLLTGALLLAASAAAQQPTSTQPTGARASLKDAQGNALGEAVLTQFPDGLLIRVELTGLPAGWHGFHIHEVGKCDPPEFKSAGGHFNPGAHKHGFAQGNPHAGDLPNLYAGADGKASVEHFSDMLRLGQSEAGVARTSLFTSGSGAGAVTLVTGASMAGNILDDDGSAIVVHAKPDDYRTDPAGASGDRIACGVIEKAG